MNASQQAEVARAALKEVGRPDLARHVAVMQFGTGEPFCGGVYRDPQPSDPDRALVSKALEIAWRSADR